MLGISSVLSSAAQLGYDLTGLGEAIHALLGEDELAIHHHVEDAAAPFDQLGIHVEGFLQLGRQTGGPGKEVSDPTVGDADSHGFSSAPSSRTPGRAPQRTISVGSKVPSSCPMPNRQARRSRGRGRRGGQVACLRVSAPSPSQRVSSLRPRRSEASGTRASVTGGKENVASGFAASVDGGTRNEAGDFAASVSGGSNRLAPAAATGSPAVCSRTSEPPGQRGSRRTGLISANSRTVRIA